MQLITQEQLKDALLKGINSVIKLVEDVHPADIASCLRELDLDDQIELITSIPPKYGAKILSQLQDISEVDEFVLAEKLPFDLLVSIIDEMHTDNAVDALLVFRKSTVSEILNKLPSEKSEVLEEMLRFDDETAGGLMTDDYLSFSDKTLVSDTIAEIKELKSDDILSTYRYIFVTDEEERLLGTLPIVDLLIHPDKMQLKKIMKTAPLNVFADVDQEKVADMFTRYDLEVLPVLNRGRKIIGRITVDDVINVINEEADEDIYKLVGSNDLEKETPSSIKIASIRLPWLLITLIGSFFSTVVIKYFNNQIGELVVLFFFMPVVMAMSGNIGVQCSTLMVRGLATGFIQMSSVFDVFFKEFKIGIIIAITCGIVASICAYLFIEQNYLLGLTVGLSMISCIIFVSMSGTAVPVILKKLGF